MNIKIKKNEENPESAEVFERIDKKIDSLFNVLRPVCSENQEPKLEKAEKTSSLLINKLQVLEDRITELLESIRI